MSHETHTDGSLGLHRLPELKAQSIHALISILIDESEELPTYLERVKPQLTSLLEALVPRMRCGGRLLHQLDDCLTEHDTLLMVTADAPTPVLLAPLEQASYSALLTCHNSPPEDFVDHWIYLPVGPDPTTMKAQNLLQLSLSLITTALKVMAQPTPLPEEGPLPQMEVHLDAGASKTKATIGDRVLSAGPANILEVGRRGVRHVLSTLFSNLEVDGVPFRRLAPSATLYAGMAGSEGSHEELISLLEEQGFSRDHIHLKNDVENLLGTGPRIVLAAGTGSYCIGKLEEKTYRSGGLGKILGDEGSGYWIGLEAIRYAIDHPGSLIAQKVISHFAVTHTRELVSPLTQNFFPKHLIASLAEVILPLSDEIALKAAKALHQLLQSVRTQMHLPSCPVTYTGSLLTKSPILSSLIDKLDTQARLARCIVGFEGTELPSDIEGVGGVILFDRNIESPTQLRKLTSDLKKAGVNIIAIDQEGGLVSRLRASKGFDTFPKLCDLKTPEEAYEVSLRQAEMLYSLGITLNFTPVVDIPVNPANFIVRAGRCFRSELVIENAKAVIKAHREFGITTVLKHFPGHGSSVSDSHEGFVDISKTWSDTELEPYRALIQEGYADMIMLGHLFHEAIDDQCPTSLSKQAVKILRDDLGYTGLIITDDLDMAAISSYTNADEAVRMALDSGVDYLLSGHRRTL